MQGGVTGGDMPRFFYRFDYLDRTNLFNKSNAKRSFNNILNVLNISENCKSFIYCNVFVTQIIKN